LGKILKDINLYTTDELIQEISKRYSDFAFVGRKYLTKKEDVCESRFNYDGDYSIVLGLLDMGKARILDESKHIWSGLNE